MVNIGPIMKGIRLSFIDSTIRLWPKLWAYGLGQALPSVRHNGVKF